MTNFITNSSEKLLKTRLSSLISKSNELKFLVGFFYFSGIRELYQAIHDNPDVKIKVLVGLNVDKTVYGINEYDHTESISGLEKVHQFMQSIKRTLPNEEFDKQDFYEQIKYFVELIKNNRLQIRKTYEPNHAKLYLFKLNEVGRSSMFITGSSNLTRPGLHKQQEFNVEISDYGCEDAESYFDQLWEEAIKITEDDVNKKRLISLIEKDTHVRNISPFEAYLLVLKTYLDSYIQKPIGNGLCELMKKNGYTPYQYQIDAVKQALAIIEQYNGVIIADVVGLGKSVIASMIGHELNTRGLIISPPGLVGDKNKAYGWKMYAEQFGLHNWEVRSLGEIEDIAENIHKYPDIEVVIIDEAHRFRNQDTQGYEHLKNVCRGRRVLLLTATPFNNKPSDILSLLELFTISKQSNITLDGNLKNRFRIFGGMFDRLSHILKNYNSPKESNRQKAQDYYNSIFGEGSIDLDKVRDRVKYLSTEIRNVIEPVTIRRNRIDLISHPIYKTEITTLSKLENPQEWFFSLTKNQSKLYDEVLTNYFADPDSGGRFTGAIYRPYFYELPPDGIDQESAKSRDISFLYTQQKNLYEFVRRMLVKRFESSFASFYASLHNIHRVNVSVLNFINRTGKYVLDRQLIEKMSEWDLDEIEVELLEYAQRLDFEKTTKKDQLYKVEDFVYREEFLNDIRKDIDLFDELIDKFDQLKMVENDPKIASLINELKKSFHQDKKRKIVVFSEYSDTVKHLAENIKPHYTDRVLVVDGNLSTSTARKIHLNFDAAADNQADDYDLLLTTDKVSEGFNLNRAGLIVNYDIPWNPVRVIQRVGRINRIGHKVFDSLYIANFFPTEQGATVVQSRTIAQNKMFLIHNTLGEDARIFDADETPQPAKLYQRLQRNPDELEEESFYITVQKLMLRYKKSHPEIVAALENFPKRVKVAKPGVEDCLFVFIRKTNLYIRSARLDQDGKPEISVEVLENILPTIQADPDTNRLELNPSFWERYQAAKDYREDRTVPLSDNSIEIKALNNITTIIQNPWGELIPLIDFLHLVKQDIADYGTLPEFTLRSLSQLKYSNDSQKNKSTTFIFRLQRSLGDGYAKALQSIPSQEEKQVIIAIENRSS